MSNESLIKSSIDYSSREFNAILQDFKKAVQQFTVEMTDTEETNPLIVLGEMFSAIADQLNFSLDRFADEAFLGPAVLRSSVINLLNLIDYQPKSALPSVVTLTFSIDAPLLTDLTIPLETQVSTSGDTAIFFETDLALVIPAGSTSGSVAATEGQTQQEDPIATSDATSFQKYQLLGNPIIDESLQLFVDEGIGPILWTEVDNFSSSGVSDNHYTTARLEDDGLVIEFGDGGQGRIPPLNATISAIYRVGGGRTGNVGNNTVNTVVSTIIHDLLPINVNVINSENAIGGEDRESTEAAKINGPNSFRTLGRAVTLQDYTDLSEQVSGVGKAQSLQTPINIVTTFIVDTNGEEPTQTLLDLVKDTVGADGIKSPTIDYRTAAPNFIDIKISAIVNVKVNFTNAAVETAVIEEINEFFELANLSFGETDTTSGNINLSDISAVIDNVNGVDSVDFTDMTMIPFVKELTNSGNGVFEDFALSESTIDETWQVKINGLDNSGFAVLYSVTGSISGVQANAGIMNVPYVSDGSIPKIAFIFKTGTQLQKIGDTFDFRVSKKVGNVFINNFEIARHQLNSDGTFVFSNLTFIGGA